MRWIPYIMLAYVTILVQTSLGRILTIPLSMGQVGPDMAAALAVFVALRARTAVDCMLAAWILGLCLDLTTGGGPGTATVVGPMPIAYALAAGAIFRIREAFFRDRAATQALVVMFFVVLSHSLWVTIQTLRMGDIGWSDYGWLVLQVLLVGLYSALLAPLLQFLLGFVERAIMPATSDRSF